MRPLSNQIPSWPPDVFHVNNSFWIIKKKILTMANVTYWGWVSCVFWLVRSWQVQFPVITPWRWERNPPVSGGEGGFPAKETGSAEQRWAARLVRRVPSHTCSVPAHVCCIQIKCYWTMAVTYKWPNFIHWETGDVKERHCRWYRKG